MCVTVIASPKIYFQNFVSCDLMVNYQTLQQPVTYQNADFKVKLQWQELQWLLRAKHLLLTMYQNRIEKKKFQMQQVNVYFTYHNESLAPLHVGRVLCSSTSCLWGPTLPACSADVQILRTTGISFQ